MSILLDAESIASKSLLPSPKALTIQIGQTLERSELVKRWDIKEGDIVLELGCGQGDTTAVLATAVGESGRVIAIDPGALDYGTPPLGQAQSCLIANFSPGQIEFKCPQDPMDYLSTTDTTTIYDVAVLAHCIWYFNSPSVLLKTLQVLAKRAKRICLAEWALEASDTSAFSHVLAVLAIAAVESHNPNSQTNVRSIMSPKAIKAIAEEVGLKLQSESTFTPPHGESGMKDGMWEVQYALSGGVARRLGELVENEREKAVIQALLDATEAHAPATRKEITSMDVWTGVFIGAL
ncbi:hypothetical protein M422DRAFT_205598 [Sphaerobolus stellatus SS14]|nr:hypothetical protein M422DRAFT_205598 [Sphaerobolus stellatus SS14]